MKRPSADNLDIRSDIHPDDHEGYRKACGEWERFLPSEEELANIVLDVQESIEKEKMTSINLLQSHRTRIAEAIVWRLGGEPRDGE